MRAFVGYGELGRQIDGLLTELRGPAGAIFFDDPLLERGGTAAHPFASFCEDTFRHYEFYVCLGYKHLRRKAEVLVTLERAERSLPIVRHPTAFLSRSAAIGVGSVIYPLCNIDKDAAIGRGVLLNNSVVVSHNARIGDCSYLSPGVVLSGFATVGSSTFIGSGAVVSDGVVIGDDVVVGIGTVVTRDVPAGASVIGNPMRVVEGGLRI